jgi:hypothetical protein
MCWKFQTRLAACIMLIKIENMLLLYVVVPNQHVYVVAMWLQFGHHAALRSRSKTAYNFVVCSCVGLCNCKTRVEILASGDAIFYPDAVIDYYYYFYYSLANGYTNSLGFFSRGIRLFIYFFSKTLHLFHYYLIMFLPREKVIKLLIVNK